MMTTTWWDGRRAAAAAVLILAVPLLWPSVPPLLDLPGHMASFHVAIDLSRSPELQRYFTFQWQLIGNLGVDLLVVPLGRLVGVEMATKLIVLLIPVLTGLGFLLIARQAHGKTPPTAFAALPLAYNYPLLFGFVNYCLSVALALLALALWLRWPSRARWPARALTFAVIAAATWLAHAIGWVMLGVMCGSAELQRRIAAGERWGSALIGTVIDCLPLTAPVALILMGPHEEAKAEIWFNLFDITKWLLTLLRDRWMLFDLASVALIAALVLAAAARIGGLRLAPALAWPAAALAVLYVATPQAINGSAFVSARIAPYAAALALLAIDADRLTFTRQRMLAAASVAFLIVRLGGTTASMFLYDRTFDRELAALAHIPRGSPVLTFSAVPCRSAMTNWYQPRLYHLSGMAVVRRDAFVNGTWGIAGLHTLRVRYPQAGAFQADPSEMVFADPCPLRFVLPLTTALATAPLAAFDRLWLVGVPRERWPRDPRIQPIWSSDQSVLYRVEGRR